MKAPSPPQICRLLQGIHALGHIERKHLEKMAELRSVAEHALWEGLIQFFRKGQTGKANLIKLTPKGRRFLSGYVGESKK